MIFPMFPACFRMNPGNQKIKQYESWIVLGAGLLFVLLYVLFRLDIMLLLACLFLPFSFVLFYVQKLGNRNSQWWIRFSENTIEVIDHVKDIIVSTEYRYIRRVEVRSLILSPRSSAHGPVYVPQKCKLIMVYIDGTYSFEDIRAHEHRFFRGDDVHFYLEDIFGHHGCIAFSYNEEAWNLLQDRLNCLF